MKRTTFILPIVVILLAAGLSALFIVDEREKALVLQFGQIKSVKDEPGLAFKIPLIQEVVKYDDRIRSLETDRIEVTPSDDRRLVVDAFARYRITDVVRFRQAVGVGGERAGEDRLRSILNAKVREVLGAAGVTSSTILSPERAVLTRRISESARAEALALGLAIVDVRLKTTNLPQQNLEATFNRMIAERQREAADEIARGNEAATRVRAQAQRTAVEIRSAAQREAEIVRGEADAERNAIFAGAFGADPEFFEFYRSLTAYERALQGSNSTMVINPDSEFFEYLDGAGAALGPGVAAVSVPQNTPAVPAAPAPAQAIEEPEATLEPAAAPAQPVVAEPAAEEAVVAPAASEAITADQ